MILNYKEIKKHFGLSYKQISNLIGQFTIYGIIEHKIIDNNSVDITVKDLELLNSILFSPSKIKLKPEDLNNLLPKLIDSIKAESASVSEVTELKRKYIINQNNKYFRHFNNNHKRQFISTFAARLDKNSFTLNDLENAFAELPNNPIYSLSSIFNKLNYSIHDKLMDFLWIETEGKVANAAMEGKAAKDLVKWIEQGVTSLDEIEDVWIQVIVPSKYNLSLVSVKKALQTYSANAIVDVNNRKIFTLDSDKKLGYNDLKSAIADIRL